MKYIIVIVILSAVVAGAFLYFNQTQEPAGQPSTADPFNASYIIEGKEVQLRNGRAEEQSVPGSAATFMTFVFGEPVYGDVDGDGDEDAALVLVQDPGGSGTFYYGAVAINEGGSFRGLNALLLGDRIAPQTHEIQGDMFVYNYADRNPEDPMTESPSVGVSKYTLAENGILKEVSILTDFQRNNLLIRVVEPSPGAVVSSPVKVRGTARGYWFFEADFPVDLVNWDGLIIGQHYATAQGEWMTEDLVPFEGTVEFEETEAITGYSRRGAVILHKDNPSGLPEHDNAIEIPVVYGE